MLTRREFLNPLLILKRKGQKMAFDKKRYQGICSPMGGCGAREHA
jgi:hypothetical protein